MLLLFENSVPPSSSRALLNFFQGILKVKILRCLLVCFEYDPLAFVYLRTEKVGLDKSNGQWTAV